MYKVMIIDDEPTASRHISMILEKYGEGFQVVGTTENGLEAKKLMEKDSYDLIITDVCMPVMNGIELIEWMADQRQKAKIIVTSGYQEFEYVQKAINLGASSYLLKPVMPNKLQNMLQKLRVELDRDYLQCHKKLFNAFYYDEPCEEHLVRKIFPKERYYLAIKRINGLPTRYGKRNVKDVYADQYKSTMIYGRDLYEELFFIPINVLDKKNVMDYVKETSNLKSDLGYATLVYYCEPIDVRNFNKKVKELYRSLDSAIIIGENQMLTVDMVIDRKNRQLTSLKSDDLELVFYYINERDERAVIKEVSSLFDRWHDEKRSQIYVESKAKQILYRIRRSYGDLISLVESERLVEEVFTFSMDVNELRCHYMEIMKKFFQGFKVVDKIDTPQFLGKITDYLNQHIDEQLTLSHVCCRFGVSQPYLSKMFRKHIGESFNRYVTRTRIEKAMEFMKKNPDMKVKDVAAMVGYEDQFYFSRIFRSFKDSTPSEFMQQVKICG